MIPIRIEGVFQAWSVGAWWPRRNPVSLVVGPPVVVTRELIDEWQRQGEPYQTATQAIRGAIVALGPVTNACATTSEGKG